MTNKYDRIYVDDEGVRFCGKEVVKHHVMFTKSTFVGPMVKKDESRQLYRDFRLFPGFIFWMKPVFDTEIHGTIEPPTRPSPGLMVRLLGNAALRGEDNYDTFRNTIQYLDQLQSLQLPIKVPEIEINEAGLLLDNLLRQQPSIALGRVDKIALLR
ncbi:MAG TPA: hypothetical protein VII94_02775 [Candidatus Saccharimonadales bacterium]